MDDPQLLSADIILNMLIAYRDVQVSYYNFFFFYFKKFYGIAIFSNFN